MTARSYTIMTEGQLRAEIKHWEARVASAPTQSAATDAACELAEIVFELRQRGIDIVNRFPIETGAHDAA